MDSGAKIDLDAELERVVKYYEEYETSTIESRYLSERDRDYYDHKQWSQDELAELERRKQPAITVNRIKPKVDFLQGLERQTRTDPKAYPRTPKHEGAADAATDSLRYVMDNVEFDYTSSDVFTNELVEGTGGAEIMVSKGKDGWTVEINRYEWDRIFYDPHSRRRDFGDAKYKGTVGWHDLEDAIAMTGLPEDEAKVLLQASDEPTTGNTFDDKPVTWVDKERERVRICSIWYLKNDQWHWARFTKGGFIREPMISPFRDDDDLPQCGLELQSAFVDRDGFRYGWVRTQIDMQDEINKRRSKSLHLLSVRQFKYEDGALDDVNRTKRELAKPDGAVKVNPGLEFELLNTNDLAQGQFLLLQEATQEIDRVATTAQQDDKVRSGRAEIARQQASTMELGPIFDGHRHWKKRVYRQVWNRIRQFWTDEKWIRVTDNEENLKWVGLNKPVTVREQLSKDLESMPPEVMQDPARQQALQQIINDPRMDHQVDTENVVAELDVDIILDEAPDFMTIQAEQFEMLVQLFQANPQGVPWEAIIRASQLRNKDEILKMGKDSAAAQQAAAQAQKMQQEAFQVEMAGKMAEVDKDRAQATKYMSEAKKTQIEAGIS